MDFTSFLSVPIVVVCLIVGYIIKHVVSDETIQNKWIPVIVTCLGIVISVVLVVAGGAAVTAEAILTAVITGGISGASSTGFQSAFQAFLDKPSVTVPETVTETINTENEVDDTAEAEG